MSNMKATDKQAMEILKKLDELIASSVDLEANIDESESIEDVLLCLEDTIGDSSVTEAEENLKNTLEEIYRAAQSESFYLPKIFIRVRSCEQISRLMKAFGTASELIRGFILPKFSMENADAYIHTMVTLNEKSDRRIYMMPIFESPMIIDLRNRYEILY